MTFGFDKNKKRRTALKKLVVPVIFVWLAGAFGMSIYYDIQRKANCIEQEGFVKGWLWCETDPVSRMELSSNRIELFIRGLGWPVKMFQRKPALREASSTPSEVSETASGAVSADDGSSVASIATEEQFRSAMCALEEMPVEVRSNLRTTVRSYLQDRDATQMVRAVEVDDVPFHLSSCFKRHAVRTMSVRASDNDFKHFYALSERALILVLMLDAVSKISDEQRLKQVGTEARVEVQQRNEQYYQ